MGKHTTYYAMHKKGFLTSLHDVYILNKGPEHPSLPRDPQTQYKPTSLFSRTQNNCFQSMISPKSSPQSTALKSTEKMQVMK